MIKIHILYEDSGDPNKFGLHKFVSRMVLDFLGRTNENYHQFSTGRLKGFPKNGNSKLKEECSSTTLEKFHYKYCKHAFAVFDRDQLPRLLQLSNNPCRTLMLQRLRSDCPSGKLQFIFLDRNIESVMRKIQDSGLTSISKTTFEKAIHDKDLISRDRIFVQCADNPNPDDRLRLLEVLPDLNRLVRLAAEIFQADLTSSVETP